MKDPFYLPLTENTRLFVGQDDGGVVFLIKERLATILVDKKPTGETMWIPDYHPDHPDTSFVMYPSELGILIEQMSRIEKLLALK